MTPPIANDIYIPTFPEPKDSVVIPLDADFHTVKDEETEVVFVLVPFWYWKLVVEYKVKMERAVNTLIGKD